MTEMQRWAVLNVIKSVTPRFTAELGLFKITSLIGKEFYSIKIKLGVYIIALSYIQTLERSPMAFAKLCVL